MAAAGAEAVQHAAVLRRDVILMDIHLEVEMDRAEAAQLIQAQVPIRIVYLSAFMDASTRVRARETNAARVSLQTRRRWDGSMYPAPGANAPPSTQS
jgi:CheY-like chemotaxis protein